MFILRRLPNESMLLTSLELVAQTASRGLQEAVSPFGPKVYEWDIRWAILSPRAFPSALLQVLPNPVCPCRDAWQQVDSMSDNWQKKTENATITVRGRVFAQYLGIKPQQTYVSLLSAREGLRSLSSFGNHAELPDHQPYRGLKTKRALCSLQILPRFLALDLGLSFGLAAATPSSKLWQLRMYFDWLRVEGRLNNACLAAFVASACMYQKSLISFLAESEAKCC